jgi:ATP-dependent DNA helicase Q4
VSRGQHLHIKSLFAPINVSMKRLRPNDRDNGFVKPLQIKRKCKSDIPPTETTRFLESLLNGRKEKVKKIKKSKHVEVSQKVAIENNPLKAAMHSSKSLCLGSLSEAKTFLISERKARKKTCHTNSQWSKPCPPFEKSVFLQRKEEPLTTRQVNCCQGSANREMLPHTGMEEDMQFLKSKKSQVAIDETYNVTHSIDGKMNNEWKTKSNEHMEQSDVLKLPRFSTEKDSATLALTPTLNIKDEASSETPGSLSLSITKKLPCRMYLSRNSKIPTLLNISIPPDACSRDEKKANLETRSLGNQNHFKDVLGDDLQLSATETTFQNTAVSNMEKLTSRDKMDNQRRYEEKSSGAFQKLEQLDKQKKEKKTLTRTHNFVRSNLKNKHGSCKAITSRVKSSKQSMRDSGDTVVSPCVRNPITIDPLDDYLDGVFHNGSEKQLESKESNSAVICSRHAMACVIRIVKKAGPNRGRKFYVCSMPRGENCNFFEWYDDSIASIKDTMLKQSSYSGFLARQTTSYLQRMRMLTVPELKKAANDRSLCTSGKKKDLLIRLAVSIRNDLASSAITQENVPQNMNFIQDDEFSDDSSVELEFLAEENIQNNLTGSEIQDCTDYHTNNIIKSDKNPDDSSIELEFLDEKKESIALKRCFHGREEKDSFQQNHLKAKDCDDNLESKIQNSLCNTFGLTEFRDGQEWAIKRCFENTRSLLVAPTGSGKSLCYSLPAGILDGVCIVLSPLISLIEDQLRQLPTTISAATLSGGMTKKSIACTIDDVIKGRIKVLFLSPERLTSPSFRRLFTPSWNSETQLVSRPFPPVSLFCIDEAHCMSQWAHNFRPSYLRIKSLIGCIEPRSILAITATAGPPVIRDICSMLNITDEGVKVLKSFRDNIYVTCKVMETYESKLSLIKDLLMKASKNLQVRDVTSGLQHGCLERANVIVYVWRQRDAEVVAEYLKNSGVEGGITVYHAGLDSKARAVAQSRFLRGKVRICVATIAFGMGINKTDVDAVLHFNLPSSVEHYLQEIGRAGRDGRPSKAIALISESEALERHSLAHSDLASLSQVKVLLQLVQSRILLIRGDISSMREEADNRHLFVAIPVDLAVTSIDCKVETIETLLALGENNESICLGLRLEGRVSDVVKIRLKRDPLEKLELREPLARYFSQCAVKISEHNSEDYSHHSYCFGTYEISVSRCANMMGPSAEPRHVHAALRRLQLAGELDLTFENKGVALLLRWHSKFFLEESNLSDNAQALWNIFSTQIMNVAAKVKKIDRILREVAMLEFDESNEALQLARFQELVSDELSKNEEYVEEVNSSIAIPEGDMMLLKHDAHSVLQYLVSNVEDSGNACNAHTVRFDDPEFSDYVALIVAKYLHGIVTKKSFDSSKKYTLLFGKWKHINFLATVQTVKDCL